MSWNCEITTHGESSLWYEWIATKGLQFTGSVLIRTPRLLGACQCSHLSSPCSYLVLSLTYIIIIIVCTIVLQQHYYYCKYDVECETNRFIRQPFSLLHLRRQRSKRIEYGEKMMILFILFSDGEETRTYMRKCNQFTDALFDEEER